MKMKKYLDLVSISAKIHRKQSRMTRLCIILAVFLISAIFGMADMEIRNQKVMAVRTDGAWQVVFRGITKEQAAMIAAQPEIKHVSRYEAINYRLDKEYGIEGKKAVVCGFDEDFLRLVPAAVIVEGRFPREADEAVVTDNLRHSRAVQIGDDITLQIPGGETISYRIAGIAEATSMIDEYDAVGLFVNSESYENNFSGDTETKDMECYVEFKAFCNIQKAWRAICARLDIPEEQTAQNVKILGLMLQSNDSYMIKIYLTAAVLAMLVVVAGILMIAGSINSSVTKRTEFFGMLRCLGATKSQVARFVRREALSWCKTAIPAGLILSALVTAALCQLLKILSPGYFSGMAFGVSGIGMVLGAVIGVVTVLLAANVPARKAAKVSPLTAVSGNAGLVRQVKKAAGNWFRVEIALGIHYAWGSGRTLFLMAGSFAFSMILFLAFSTTIDFVHYAITPLKPWHPDISVVSGDETCSIPKSVRESLKNNPAVKRMYGRSFAYSVPVRTKEKGVGAAMHIISYEENQFAWAKDLLTEGSAEEAERGNGVLMDFKGRENLGETIAPGEEITIATADGEKNYPVTGILSDTPFDSEQGVLICSEETFREITGEENYVILDIQLARDAGEEDVEKIRGLALDGKWTFSDRRKRNQEVRGAYYSFVLFVYGFLAVIILITVFHIINSISMSVSARMTRFGSMRAVGMSDRQVIRMVTAEACTYALTGIAAGALIGIPVNKLCYQFLITSRWGTAWPLPTAELAAVGMVVAVSVLLSVIGPARRIREMSVVETIGEL